MMKLWTLFEVIWREKGHFLKKKNEPIKMSKVASRHALCIVAVVVVFASAPVASQKVCLAHRQDVTHYAGLDMIARAAGPHAGG